MSRPPLAAADEVLATPVEVSVADEQSDHPVDCDHWMAFASRVLAAERVGVGLPQGVEMTLVFVDEASIAGLNERFMGKQGPTDVLSFPIDEEAAGPGPIGPEDFDDDGLPVDDEIRFDQRIEDDRFRERLKGDDDAPLMLGDVMVCPAYAARQAPLHVGELHDGSLEHELELLVVHGILHLLGMDHEVDSEAEEMEAREREHLRRFRGETT